MGEGNELLARAFSFIRLPARMDKPRSTGLTLILDKGLTLQEAVEFFKIGAGIEHLRDPSTYLEEINRVLKPCGHIILITPHWPYAAKEFYDTYTHVQPYSARSLRSALQCHGFKVQAMVPWLVEKSDFFWKIPPPYGFLVAALLPFAGLNQSRWVPALLKGKSKTLLALGQKKLSS